MAKLRLLCFPYAGSGPSAFLGWNRLLPPTIELRCIAPPGCELRDDEPPETDLGRYLDAIVDELCREPRVPLALYGHSLGGLVAYEVARRLEAADRPAVRLVIGAKEPAEVPLLLPDLHLRDDEGLLEGLRIITGTDPTELRQDAALMAFVLHRLRADWTLLVQFPKDPVPRLRTSASVFWSPEDPSTVAAELRRWDARFESPVIHEGFPGGHLFLNQQAPRVVRALCAHLGIDAPHAVTPDS